MEDITKSVSDELFTAIDAYGGIDLILSLSLNLISLVWGLNQTISKSVKTTVSLTCRSQKSFVLYTKKSCGVVSSSRNVYSGNKSAFELHELNTTSITAEMIVNKFFVVTAIGNTKFFIFIILEPLKKWW